MIRQGEAEWLKQNINSLVALVFVGAFAGGAALLVWHAAFEANPLADGMASIIASQDL